MEFHNKKFLFINQAQAKFGQRIILNYLNAMKNLHLFPIVSLSIVLISFVVQGNVSSPSKRLKRDRENTN